MITFLDELSDKALKKEATSEAKSDTFSVIMKVGNIFFSFQSIIQLLIQKSQKKKKKKKKYIYIYIYIYLYPPLIVTSNFRF